MRKIKLLITCVCLLFFGSLAVVNSQVKPDTLSFKPFVWKSETPTNCPFKQSKELNGIKFLGLKSGLHVGDTWYPTWAENDNLYSPYTDGGCVRLDGSWENSSSWDFGGERATTAQAVIEGNDPLTLKVYSIGLCIASSLPYKGRYPCGSLIYNNVWYYGTYCLGPDPFARYGNMQYNWPWLGPFVGFRYSTDFGRSWKECPHTPEKPIFGETGINGYPVKIGSPHFVDFGKNMQYSPDGKAYLVAHGADINDQEPRFGNDSWITGDQIYLIRITPTIENINDISKYEFYAGKDSHGKAIWTSDFKNIKPLLEWNNNMGCVTVTYDAPLKKYLMCVTDGGNTSAKMSTSILEADDLTGEWKLVTYLKDFGEQAYFVNFPSKFISQDGRTAWLLYSSNFAPDWNGVKIQTNPPGGHYGMVLQKVEFLSNNMK
jgi:hypothetical protein